MSAGWHVVFYAVSFALVLLYVVLEALEAPVIPKRLWIPWAGVAVFIAAFLVDAIAAAT